MAGAGTEIRDLLKEMVEKRASDLHLKVGRPPLMRIDGALRQTDHDRVSLDNIRKAVYTVLDEPAIARLESVKGVDIAYSLPGLSRFRVNVFFQRGTMAMVIRVVPFHVSSVEELRLPALLGELALSQSGLILLTGPAGCGKSTTLAAMVDHINQRQEKQIICIEDPIEYLFNDKLSSIIQREVGTDTISFSEGLRMILRQDPDVIVIGEMRDLETMQTALSSAETGHLVLSTMHTTDVAQAVDRIVDSFPSGQQKQIRIQLSQTVRAVITQRLVPRKKEGGRAAAVEIMVNSPEVQDILMEGRTGELYEVVRGSVENFGMQTLEQSLVSLSVHDEIAYEDARTYCNHTSELDRALRSLYPDYV